MRLLIGIQKLSPESLAVVKKTISDNATFALVSHHLVTFSPLSVVRMGDGENILLTAGKDNPDAVVSCLPPEWLKRQACAGITYRELTARILRAGNECDIFAPSISGTQKRSYRLYHWFNPRPFYADNFFINNWTHAQKRALITSAKRVVVIHAKPAIVEAFKNTYGLDYTPRYIPHSCWQDTETVISSVLNGDEQLVLFSAGPSGKWLAPAISKTSKKVVIDVGNAMPSWAGLTTPTGTN